MWVGEWWATKTRYPWGVKFEPIYWFIFHSIFIPNGGMVGFRAVKSWFILSSLPPVYPPYKSGVKKKSSRT